MDAHDWPASSTGGACFEHRFLACVALNPPIGYLASMLHVKVPSANKLPFKPRLKAAERRAVIEVAAAELFAARGYEASSLDDIARAAGITKRVIYDHFASKAELQTALLHKHAEELLTFVAERVSTGDPPEERMKDGVEAFFGFVEEHPFVWRMLFRDPPTNPTIASAHRDVQDRATAGIAALLATEPQFSRKGADWLQMMAEQLKAAVNGLAGWWYEHPHVPRTDIVGAAMDFAWVGVRELAEPTDAA